MRAPVQRCQFRLQLPLLGTQAGIFLRCLCLALQMAQLFGQFLTHIAQTRQILAGLRDPVFGFTAPLLVLGDAGRLFQ
jgi:hypothetical protein